MARVSVIMPAFNAEAFISQAIESVLNQTFTDFELLVCDDSSTDSTPAIIKGFSDKDSRVKLISNKYEKGASGARNTCLSVAQGEYIAFLDSDDYWDSRKLRTQLEWMITHGITFSYSDYYMFGEYSKKNVLCRDVVDFDLLTYTCDIGCLTVIIHKTVLSDLLFPNSPKEDYALWLQILKRGNLAYNHKKSYAYYRKSAKSLSSNKFKEIFKQYYVLKTYTDLHFFSRVFRVLTYIYWALKKHI